MKLPKKEGVKLSQEHKRGFLPFTLLAPSWELRPSFKVASLHSTGASRVGQAQLPLTYTARGRGGTRKLPSCDTTRRLFAQSNFSFIQPLTLAACVMAHTCGYQPRLNPSSGSQGPFLSYFLSDQPFSSFSRGGGALLAQPLIPKALGLYQFPNDELHQLS